MKILLTFTAGIALLVAAGLMGSARSQAAQNDVYAFGVTSQNPGCTEDGPPICLSSAFTFRVLAVQHGDGHAWGEVSRFRHESGTTRNGYVTCMTVADGKAAIGGIETTPVSVPFLLYVQDRGVPGDSVSDRIGPYSIFPPGDPGLSDLPPDFPRTCPSPDSPGGYFPQASGDITVTGE
jgi:hypothetical protein